MAFLVKWTGLDVLKEKLEARLCATIKKAGRQICVEMEEEPEPKKQKREMLVLPVDCSSEALITNALDKASDMADTNSTDQYVYNWTSNGISVYRERSRIEVATRPLGHGSFAQVRQAYDTGRGIKLACKLFSAHQLAATPRMQETLAREIASLRMAEGPFVVKFEGLLVTRDHVCILMELIEGEELFDYIIRKKKLSEDEARPILYNLLKTMTMLHAKGIVHRDLKLENIMITADKQSKLIDFGLSRSDALINTQMQTRCGSEEYAAPEILQGHQYDPRLSDAWSFGVIMYACLMGSLPFNPDMVGDVPVRAGPRSLCNRIIAGGYYLPDGALSREASALIKCLLVTIPKYRMSLDQALNSSFFVTHNHNFRCNLGNNQFCR